MNTSATTTITASRTEAEDDFFQLPWSGWEEDISEIRLPTLTVEDGLEANIKAGTDGGGHDVASTFGFDISDDFPGYNSFKHQIKTFLNITKICMLKI